MNKLFLSVLILSGCAFVFSCNSSGNSVNAGGERMSDRAKKNLENARAIAKMFELGDFSRTAEFVAADAVDHSTPAGQLKGADSIKFALTFLRAMMKSLKNEIVKELADDDYVMIWVRQTFTARMNNTKLNLIAGQETQRETIEVTKHNADGKITDHWEFTSNGDLMKIMKMLKHEDVDPDKLRDSADKKTNN